MTAIKAQDKSMKMLFTRFEKYFYRAYREILGIRWSEEDEKNQKEINYPLYEDLSEE